MKSTTIMPVVTKSFNKIGMQLQKHSPEILIVTGVVGTVASTVLACKATTKVADILEDAKGQLADVHAVVENEDYADKYTSEDAKKDTVIIYAQTGVKLAKLYAPAIALGVLSIGSILASNNILRKRNVAIAAAYTAVDKSFKEYRNRVIDRFGETVDRELKYNIKAEKITETVIDEETGKETKVKKTVDVLQGNKDYSDYARFFDEGCAEWRKDPEYNLMYVRAQQQYANDLLHSRGHLFLNEVYDMLGVPRTQAGQVVGWVYDEKNPKGDNYVDFGIYDVHYQPSRDFVNGYEPCILLDFNVDGTIWELI